MHRSALSRSSATSSLNKTSRCPTVVRFLPRESTPLERVRRAMPDTRQQLRNKARLWELIWGCAASQAIHVAAELDIPELLQERPRTCEEIASATSTDAWTLGGVLRVLAACEILAIDSNDRYSLAE